MAWGKKMENVKTVLKKKKKIWNKEAIIVACIFILPVAVRIFFTNYYVSFESLIYSFFKYDYSKPTNSTFVGLQNYITILKSDMFWLQVKNTLTLYLMGLLLFPIPLIQAIFLNEITKGHKLLRFLYVVPCGLPAMAGYSVWTYIWNPEVGVANVLMEALGLARQTWLSDPKLIKWCLTIPGMVGGGMGVLTYLVVIQGVNPSLYEAAKVDGATSWQQVWYITLPNIMYYISISFVLGLTGMFSSFDGPYIMTNGTGGIEHSAETVIMGVYNRAYDLMQYGQAMAMSVTIVLITLVVVIISQTLKKRIERND